MTKGLLKLSKRKQNLYEKLSEKITSRNKPSRNDLTSADLTGDERKEA